MNKFKLLSFAILSVVASACSTIDKNEVAGRTAAELSETAASHEEGTASEKKVTYKQPSFSDRSSR